MATQSDLPPWLVLLEVPGVIEVLACLHNHGPADHTTLCAYVEPGNPDTVTTSAVRQLAAVGLLRLLAPAAGSLDHPSSQNQYELTRRGHDLALALSTLNQTSSPHARNRRSERRHH
jgi:hypothetical protein